MRERYQANDYAAASQAGQWALKDEDGGGYDLACCLALNQQTEASFYFLQRAAEREGVDFEHAQTDPDLDRLRKDSRWPAVAGFLQEIGDYWAGQHLLQTRLLLPDRSKVPDTVVVGLHGLGGSEQFVSSDLKSYADTLGMAFLGVNATNTLGPKAFRWSEDLRKDQAQLEMALQSLKPKLQARSLILFGFSQGGQLAFELAARMPTRVIGALILSPGFVRPLTETLLPRREQKFVILAGAGEHPATLAAAQADASRARQGGAEVRLKLYEGVTSHAFPPDFSTQLVNWLSWINTPRPH